MPVLNLFCWHLAMRLAMMKKQPDSFQQHLAVAWDVCAISAALQREVLVCGLAYAPEDPKDMDNKLLSYRKVRELNKALEEEFGTVNCSELLTKYATREAVEKRQHHQVICKTVLASAAGNLYDKLVEDGKLR